MSIHQITPSQFVIGSGGMWLPGVYESRAAARYAFQFHDETLTRLQSSVNPGGVITMEMLKRARKAERSGAPEGLPEGSNPSKSPDPEASAGPQGSAGEAPALEGAPPDLMDLPADMAPHRAFDEWLRNNGSAYAVEERPVTCWRFAFGAFMAGVRHQRRSAAQGSPARSAPESPRGSTPSQSPEIEGCGTPGGRET
jgi:hypothetical protein